MLHFQDGEVEGIPAEGRVGRCSACGEREASWKAEARVGGKDMDFCGWCLLYSGMAKWGHENRDDILYAGEYTRALARKSQSKKTHVPELDKRHRFAEPMDAERYVMGIMLTSRMLENGPLGRFGQVRRRAEELLGDDGE